MTPAPTESKIPFSALTDEDSLELRNIADSTSGGPSETIDAPYDSTIGLAAFLGGFDPLQLIPNADENDLHHLLADCIVSTDGETARWTLKAEVRARVWIQAAATPGGIAALAAQAKEYLQRSSDRPDAVTTALIQLSSGTAPDVVSMDKQSLAAYQSVLGLLEPASQTFPFDPKTLLIEIQLAELLEPFRFLTGYDPATGKDLFIGRKDDLRQLRSFVDVLASEGIIEAVTRSGSRIAQSLAGSTSRALLVSGIGGVGKSTLIAKFVLQHVTPATANPLRFAYLDFDRSTVSAAQPATLLLEIARQVGWQIPGARSQLDSLRARIREHLAVISPIHDDGYERTSTTLTSSASTRRVQPATFLDLPEELLGPSVLHAFLNELNSILTTSKAIEAALLLVFDTFEEAQALGDEAVQRVARFVNAATARMSNLRVVIAGRDEAIGFEVEAQRMTVGEFRDQASRRAFLEARGVSRRYSDKVADEVGGRPLALLLAARLVNAGGLKAASLSVVDRLKGLFTDGLIEGILYSRILDHIKDPEVRKLVHPGLVVRRVDGEVIREVIAPVLGLVDFSTEKIDRVMEALRHQRDLIRVEPDGSVRHRPDVREQMLVLMTAEKPEMVRDLHVAAAAYYARRQTNADNSATEERDRVEEIYHRLSTGSDLAKMPELWISKARLDLGRAVREISDLGGRGTLKVLLGRTPSPDELDALPPRMLSEFATRSLRLSLRGDAPEVALATMETYGSVIPDDAYQMLRPTILDRAGLWDEANKYYRQMLDRSSSLSLAALLELADFYERFGAAERFGGDLAEVIANKDDPRAQRSAVRRLPALLATARLRCRKNPTISGHVSAKDLGFDISSNEVVRPFAGNPTNDIRWVATLSDELAKLDVAVFGNMPVSGSVRVQLDFLSAILQRIQPQDGATMTAAAACRIILSHEEFNEDVRQGLCELDHRESVIKVLRHVLRPSTPQWYVPLACSMRDALGTDIPASLIDNEELPPLPLDFPDSSRSTKELADALGTLDQLGVLGLTLGRFLRQEDRLVKHRLGGLYRRYDSWRADLFSDLDHWTQSLIGPYHQGLVEL